MILLCPRCGTEFPTVFRGEWFDTARKCSECGVAAADPPAMLAPSATEVTYGLDEWPVGDRTALTGALADDDIPYRWQAGIVLVVPEAVEAVVEGILDDLEGPGDEPGVPGNGDIDLAVAIDDGGEAHAAMSDMFIAADRLQHAPGEHGLVMELAAVADRVASSFPPYGVERSAWRRVHELAVAVGEEADEDGIAGRAAALRDFLRPYV